MGVIFKIVKDNKTVGRTKELWDKKYSKKAGYTLWMWKGKGEGWEFIKMSILPKTTLDPSLCITEADRILYRINKSLQELHNKRAAGVV